jgi:hypothetical protein
MIVSVVGVAARCAAPKAAAAMPIKWPDVGRGGRSGSKDAARPAIDIA